MKNYIEFVNMFFGSEVYKPTNSHPLHKKWFAYKPKIGNLSPACGLPFSAFSVVPYSGGYPTGYGRFMDSSDSTPLPFKRHKTIKGFTHFSQSGTGFIDNFYNYFLIAPTLSATKVLGEKATPGYYEVKTKSYSAFVTSGGKYNVYHFENLNGKVRFYPGYAGLHYPTGLKHKNCKFTAKQIGDTIIITADYVDVKIHFAIRFLSKVNVEKFKKGFSVVSASGTLDFVLSFSFVNEFEAFKVLENALPFEKCVLQANSAWQSVLDKVEYKGKNPEMFYSALHFALKKPCLDEGFTCTAFDFATLWDMYKTQLPLAFLLYPEESKKIVLGLEEMFLDGYFTNARLMETKLSHFCEGQAKCLAPILLSTAKLYGYELSDGTAENMINDVCLATKEGLILPVVAHNLDVYDGVCALQNASISSEPIEDVAERYKSIFDEFGVLIKDIKDAKFYEGNKWNYSFRVGASTKERLKLTDRAKLKSTLDEFFGYGKDDVKDFVIPQRLAILRKLNAYGDRVKRFEGLNNEPDMDTPFLYHYIGEFARCDEVVDAARQKFRPTPDGLCGNDDSGGLTSWYVWAAMGIYPVVGTNEFLVFGGEADEVTLHLQGRDFSIMKGDVQEPTLNGKPIKNRTITIADLQRGGTLVYPAKK